MSYVASSPPRAAPNEQRCPPSAAMSRRYRHASPSARVLAALAALEITCSCKCSLIVACAIDTKPGCDERREDGLCGCRPRWLPTCILERETPFGCKDWREGHNCRCEHMYMPRCLVTGCDERRKGRRCYCARTTTEICPHLAAKIKEYAGLSAEAANRMANVWAEQLWLLLPQQYADRPLAAAGRKTHTQDGTVALRAIRQAFGLSLWHPADDCGHLDAEDMLRRQGAGLRRLFGIGTATKGGAA